MGRPHKPRKVCQRPHRTRFGPPGCSQGETVVMTIDEYEAIRLIDLEGLTQQECAQQMNVARTTVQAIYTSGRQKLAAFLVHGLELKIKGGTVEFCQRSQRPCGDSCCPRRQKVATLVTKEDDDCE